MLLFYTGQGENRAVLTISAYGDATDHSAHFIELIKMIVVRFLEMEIYEKYVKKRYILF